MDMLKKCFSSKVLIGLGIAGLAVSIVAPKAFFAALPLLLLAACPLSMAAMMLTMKQSDKDAQPLNDERDQEYDGKYER